MDSEFYREKGFYDKFAIGVFYVVLIGLCVYLFFAPREVEIVGNEVRMSAPISLEFIIFGGLFFSFAIMIFSIIALSNAKNVHAKWNHTKQLRGPCQQGMEKGEPIKLLIDNIRPFSKLPPEEKRDTLEFIKNNLENLRETSNIGLIEDLLAKIKRRKRKQVEKDLKNTKDSTEKIEYFKDKVSQAKEEFDKEIGKLDVQIKIKKQKIKFGKEPIITLSKRLTPEIEIPKQPLQEDYNEGVLQERFKVEMGKGKKPIFNGKETKAYIKWKKTITPIPPITSITPPPPPPPITHDFFLTEEEKKLLEQDEKFLKLLEKYLDYSWRKLRSLVEKKDKTFTKFTRMVARKLSNMYSWSSLVGSIDGDGGYEVDGFLIDLFENHLYKALIRNMVIQRAISYLKSDFKPDVIQILNEIDFNHISISLITLKRETTFRNFPKLPFNSIIMISREDINESLHYIIGDIDEFYGYDIPFDTAYVHTALFGFSKFDRPVLCLLHAYGKNEGLFQSIAEANKINEVMKDIMLATINDLEAKKKVHDTKIDSAVRYSMELEEIVEVDLKDTKAIREDYIKERLEKMRINANTEYEEYDSNPLWVKACMVIALIGVIVFFVLLFMTEGDLSVLFNPANSTVEETNFAPNIIRGLICR